jgi:cation:H+ antiporter
MMSRSPLALLLLALIATLPGMAISLAGVHPAPALASVVYGAAILGAAFLLAWATEAIQHDLPQALALSILALIAILPEYAVDVSFAYKAATDRAYEAYAVANMTGANRLLIGIAWPLVVLLFFLARRARGVTLLAAGNRAGLICLGAATLYGMAIPFRGAITLLDAAVLIAIFLVYVALSARAPTEEPSLIGPAALLGALPTTRRRLAVGVLMLWAIAAVLLVAERFGEALVEAGTSFGIDEFLLVQWLAPLASEAPEFVIVALWTLRGDARMALGALVSSTVNQWTLLVSSLPIAYSAGARAFHALPLGARQADELFLTASFSALAIAFVLNMHLDIWESAGLVALFALAAALPAWHVPLAICCTAIAGIIFVVWLATGRRTMHVHPVEPPAVREPRGSPPA